MRHIIKGQEPASFADWKSKANEDWQPTWDILQNPEKEHLRGALINEQYSLCCYCTKRIATDDSHIEHLQPRRDYADRELMYSNLLACCTQDARGPHSRHCGATKDAWYDARRFVAPTQTDCEEHFRYTAAGEILSSGYNDDAATETIERLNLNASVLVRLREFEIDGLLTGLDQLSDNDLRTLCNGLNRPDTSNRLPPFAPALIHIIEGLLR